MKFSGIIDCILENVNINSTMYILVLKNESFHFEYLPKWSWYQEANNLWLAQSKKMLYRLSTLVGSSNDPPRKNSESLYCITSYIISCCILGNNKRPIDLSRIVKTGRKWSKLVKTGNDLPCSWDFYLNISEPNFSSIWSFTLRTIIHILWKFDNSEYFYFPL